MIHSPRIPIFSTAGATKILSFLFGSLLFGIAYTQPRLYYSNQHQYFLHGLAAAGEGFLNRDWLANTADPTPLFSALVSFTARYLHPWLFYLYYLLILGAYLHALIGIYDSLYRESTPRMRGTFLTLLVVLHSGLLRWCSAQVFGVDYPWYFQAGVANQYILGAGLQPSVFGVLLVLSVSTFLNNRPYLAATWAALAGVIHSTYLLSAAMLTLSYLYLLLRDGRRRDAAFVGLWALLLVSPVVVYNLIVFAPSSPATFAEAQHLLAHFRIPHHTQIHRWLDGIAWAQIGWILLAMFLVRGSRLFVVLSVCFVGSLALTLVQVATGNDTLALLFPWRTSSFLVPIATGVILTKMLRTANKINRQDAENAKRRKRGKYSLVCQRGSHPLLPFCSSLFLFLASSASRRFILLVDLNHFAFCSYPAMKYIYGFVLIVFVTGGVVISYFGLGYHTNTQETKLLEYIRDLKAAEDVYLLPVELPNLTSGQRGAASLNFTPPPQRSTQKKNISVDLQQFRLFTGAPIYIDFKSIPYKDAEVLEWHRRVLWNHRLYEQRDWNKDEIAAELTRRKITHIVAAADRAISCDALILVYADEHYRLYRLRLP